jgi:endonuclease/exonuclease/phosphatase family metal-dependent hydrolase
MTYNILEGGTGRIDPLAEVIRLAQADVVMVQEAWDAALFHKLADRLGMDRFLAENPRTKGGGVGVLSRCEIREAVNYGPTEPRLTRAALHVIVRAPEKPQAQNRQPPMENAGPETGRDLALIGLHLHAWETLENEKIRMGELAAILDIASGFRGRDHVVAGDFNATHPGQQVDLSKARAKTRQRAQSQGGVLPRDVVRKMLEQGYVDAHALHHAPPDFQASFTTSHPALRVDYIFVTAGLAPIVKSCDVFQTEIGRFASDHYPVIAELAI